MVIMSKILRKAIEWNPIIAGITVGILIMSPVIVAIIVLLFSI